MKHYDESTLRLKLGDDGEDALRQHLKECAQCRGRAENLRDNETFVRDVLSDELPRIDVESAYHRVVERELLSRRGRWPMPVAWLATALVLVAALVFTPLGGYATQLLTIFEPKDFTPLHISATDAEQLRLAPDLDNFGTLRIVRTSQRPLRSLAAAEALVGFAPQRLRYVPPGLQGGRVQSYFSPLATVSFTFRAAKAQAYERRFHRNLPPLPPGLDGTTIRSTLGPMVATAYGNIPRSGRGLRNTSSGEGLIVFVQSRLPRVTSTSASLQAVVSYLLSLPDVPEHVAEQLRAISDPGTTLPIPLIVDRQRATSVQINGVQGLVVGDQTGLGSAVMWQKNGILYALAGPVRESDLLALANSAR